MDSSLWMAYYYRGIAWHQLGKLKEAKKDLRTSLKLNANVAETHAKLGDLHLQSFDLTTAENYYYASVEVNPSYSKGYYKLGNTNVYQGQPRKAQRHYEKAIEINPNSGNAYTALGIMKFRVKKDDNVAFGYFNKAVDVDQSNSLSHFWRGLANASLEKLDQTLADWNKAVEFSPNNLFYLNMRGYLNFELKKYADAFRDFRKIVMSQSIDEDNYRYNQTLLDKKIDIQFAIRYMIRNSYGLPEEALLSVQKACCFLLTGAEEVALTDLNKAQKIEKAPSIFFLKAVAFENIKKYDSALFYYSKAIELDNDIFDAHKKRAIYRYEMKDWKGAYADLKEMLRIQPNSRATFRLSGLIKTDLKDYYGALIDITKFIKLDTTDADMWKTRGYCRNMIKDHKGAISDYYEALRIKPKSAEILTAIADTYFQAGDTLKSIDAIRKISQFQPENIRVTLTIADLFTSIKEFDSCRHYLNPILSSHDIKFYDPLNYADAQFINAKMLIKSGDIDGAIKSLDLCIRIDANHLEGRLLRAKAYLTIQEESKAIKDLKFLKGKSYTAGQELYLKYKL